MDGAVTGISDHGGWAILVTLAHDGTFIERRRVELVDPELPAIPHHHEAQLLPLDEGIALVERVGESAQRNAAQALETLAQDVPGVTSIALRERQLLPPTIAERITDYRARNVADWIMYREALASAASARGWSVHWFDPKAALATANEFFNGRFDDAFLEMRKTVGAPWNNGHKLAMSGAISRLRSTLLALAILAVFFFASRGAADAALHVCNGTDSPVTVAIATLESGVTGIQSESEGWFQIDSQQCTLVIDTDLNPDARYFLYAKSVTTLWAGDGGGGTRDAAFCTNFAGKFFYVNRSRAQCTGAGEEMLWFIHEPISRLDWTINLDNP